MNSFFKTRLLPAAGGRREREKAREILLKDLKSQKSQWTKEGRDTLEEEDVWDDDAYYAHLDDLEFD